MHHHSQYNFGETAALMLVFAEAKQRRRARQPHHILIVEDDALTRRIVSHSFREHYAVINAANAQEAITNYLLHAPDIVFLDIGLPDASGFEVLREILACDPQAYVVMFSSNHGPDTIRKALDEGAKGFVAKPFTKQNLSDYIVSSIKPRTGNFTAAIC